MSNYNEAIENGRTSNNHKEKKRKAHKLDNKSVVTNELNDEHEQDEEMEAQLRNHTVLAHNDFVQHFRRRSTVC